MPIYDLQYDKTDCGNVIISGSAPNPSIQYQSQNPPSPPIDIPGATCSAANPSDPQVGDKLNLNNFVAKGHKFSGDGLFQNQKGAQKKGYYHRTISGGGGDWDAADGGGGRP